MSKRKAKSKAVALSSAARVADAREANPEPKHETRPWKKGQPIGRPGQAITDHLHSHGKLDDELEAQILEHVAAGSTWTDSARLCGISYSTTDNWRTRGAAFNKDPEARPQDWRYGLFVERVEKAVVAAKALIISKIFKNEDWRAWRFWLINNSEYKSEHVRSEVSGVDGSPIAVQHQINPFEVHFTLAGPEIAASDFKVVDHSQEHKESAQLEDPYSYIPPKNEGTEENYLSPAERVQPAQQLSPYDPMGARGKGGGDYIKPRSEGVKQRR